MIFKTTVRNSYFYFGDKVYHSIPRHARNYSSKKQLEEIDKWMEFDLKTESKVSYTWEDNIGAQNLPNLKGPLINPRTKHIGIKYYWFWSKISLNKIVIDRINTKEQGANLFTKSLTRFGFEKKRSLTMDW